MRHRFQNLAPTYEKLADAFSHAKDKVVIAKVDADGVGKPLGNKYDVKGFPSSFIFETNSIRSPYECIFKTALQWFDAAGTHEKYEGGRDLDSLAALYVFFCLDTYVLCDLLPFFFSSVTQKSGVKSNIKPPPPPETTILDVYNFDEIVMVRYCFCKKCFIVGSISGIGSI